MSGAEMTTPGAQRFCCPAEPDENGDFQGCGTLFLQQPCPEDGWVDCPECGLTFDPRVTPGNPAPLTRPQEAVCEHTH